MANAFDSANYPEAEPDRLTAGDRWAWKRTDLGSDYPPASYALTYEAVRHGEDGTSFTITASESGQDYLVEVASATTDGYPAGTYRWAAFITRSSDSERIRIGTGTWVVLGDPADDKTDPRTFNARMLDAIQSTLEGRATQAHSAYSIGDRSVTRMAPDELERWRGIYAHRVAAEINTDRVRRGYPSANRVQMRFVNG